MPTVGDATIQVLADTSPAEKAFAGFVSDLGKLLTKSGKDLSKQLAPKPDASFGKSTIAAAGKVGAQAGAALSQGVKAGFGKTPTGLIVPSDLVNPAKQAGTQAGKVSADAVARSFETTARTGMKRAGDKAGKDAGDAVTKQAEKGGKEAGRRLSKGFEQIVSGGILFRVFDQFGEGFKKVFEEIDDGSDSLVIQMGAAGKKIESIATSVARATVQGLDISKPATASIAVQLGLTGKALQETSIDLLDFSRITKTDVTQNIRGLDTVLQGFNLTGKDARNVMGQLVLEMQHSGTPVDELLSKLSELGPLLRSMNLDFDDSVKAIGALRGEDVSSVFEGLRFATLLAAGASEKATEDAETLKQAIESLGAEIVSLGEDAKSTGDALAEAMKPATVDELAEATIGVERARLGQRDAARAVIEAERDLAAIEARGATNAAELQREERNLARARINHQNAIDRIADAERRLDEIRLGLSGTMRTLKDQELSLEGARLGVKDAADRVEDSEKALKDARKTGDAEAISDAERDLAHARLDQKQAIQSQSDEEKRLQLARQDAAKGDGQKADAERDLASAHLEEQDAAAAQRDQESKIAALRSKGAASTSELAAAQDKLTGARLNARQADIDLHKSETELQTVRDQGSAKDPAVIQALKDKTKATDELAKKQKELLETQDALNDAETVIGLDPEVINRANAAIAALGPSATEADKAAAALKELSAGRTLSPRLVARLQKLADVFARGKIDAKNFTAQAGDASKVVGTLEGETHDLADTIRELINTLKTLPGAGGIFGVLAPVAEIAKVTAAIKILRGAAGGGGLLSGLFSGISGSSIGLAVSSLAGSIGSVLSGVGTAIAGAAASAGAALAGAVIAGIAAGIGLNRLIEAFLPGVNNALEAVGGALFDFFTALPGKIIGWLVDLPGNIVEFFTKLPGWVIGAIDAAGDFLFEIGKKIILGLVNGFIDKGKAVFDFFKELPGKILDKLKDAGTWLLETGKSVVKGLKNGITDLVNDPVKFFKELPGKILEIFKDAKSLLFNVGKKIVAGLLQGVIWLIRRFPVVGNRIADELQKVFNNVFEIQSPSKVMFRIGQQIGEGLNLGIEDSIGAGLSIRTPSIGELQTLSRSSSTSSALSSSTRAMARDDHSVTFGDVIIQHSETPEATARIFMNRVARAMTR